MFTSVVLITDDEYWSEELAGRKPLKRDYLAKLIEAIAAKAPGAIVLDVDFMTTAGVFAERYEETVKLIHTVASVSNNVPVVLSHGLRCREIPGNPAVVETVSSSYSMNTLELRPLEWVDKPISLGFLHLHHDIRRIPLNVEADGNLIIPSLSLAAVGSLDARQSQRITEAGADNFAYGSFLDEIEYAAFTHSAKDVLHPGFPAGADNPLRTKVVLVGGSWHDVGAGLGQVVDLHKTPAGALPGVFVHANYIESMLKRESFAPLHPVLVIIIELTLVFAIAVLMAGLHSSLAKLGVAVGGVLVFLFMNYFAFQNLGLYADFFFPMVALALHPPIEKFVKVVEAGLGVRHPEFPLANRLLIPVLLAISVGVLTLTDPRSEEELSCTLAGVAGVVAAPPDPAPEPELNDDAPPSTLPKATNEYVETGPDRRVERFTPLQLRDDGSENIAVQQVVEAAEQEEKGASDSDQPPRSPNPFDRIRSNLFTERGRSVECPAAGSATITIAPIQNLVEETDYSPQTNQRLTYALAAALAETRCFDVATMELHEDALLSAARFEFSDLTRSQQNFFGSDLVLVAKITELDESKPDTSEKGGIFGRLLKRNRDSHVALYAELINVATGEVLTSTFVQGRGEGLLDGTPSALDSSGSWRKSSSDLVEDLVDETVKKLIHTTPRQYFTHSRPMRPDISESECELTSAGIPPDVVLVVSGYVEHTLLLGEPSNDCSIRLKCDVKKVQSSCRGNWVSLGCGSSKSLQNQGDLNFEQAQIAYARDVPIMMSLPEQGECVGGDVRVLD